MDLLPDPRAKQNRAACGADSAQIAMAQLLSRYKISLPGARPVLPVGRVTIEPSHEPLFRLDAV
jgi:hypothetical protein